MDEEKLKTKDICVSLHVYMEATFGLDTTAFLNGFCRMVNRRGVPVEVTTDNGGYIVAAANKELIKGTWIRFGLGKKQRSHVTPETKVAF